LRPITLLELGIKQVIVGDLYADVPEAALRSGLRRLARAFGDFSAAFSAESVCRGGPQ